MNGSRKTRPHSFVSWRWCIKYMYMWMNICSLNQQVLSNCSWFKYNNCPILYAASPPIPHPFAGAVVYYVVYYSFYTQIRTIAFIRKIIFSLFTDCAAHWSCLLSERFVIHASLMNISNRVALDTASHYRWRAGTIKKGLFETALPQYCKSCSDATELKIYRIL